MATFTPNRNFYLPSPNGDVGVWGTEINENWSSLDTILGVAGSNQGPIGPAGPAGPAGPQGPQGPQGPAGTGSNTSFSGWQELASYTVSSQQSQSFPLPGPSRRFRVTLQGITVNTNGASLAGRFSLDGGITFVQSGYANWEMASLNGGTPAGASSGGKTFMTMSTLLSDTNFGAFDGTFEIFPGIGGLSATMFGKGMATYNSGSGSAETWIGDLASNLTAGMINGMQIFSTYFSGTIIVEGLT